MRNKSTRRHSTILKSVAAIAALLAILVLVSLPRYQAEQVVEATPSAELTEAAEGLNDVLPQRIARNTLFDSVGVGLQSMSYYYTLSDITEEDYVNKGLQDSLMTEAENRIPCTVWRPVYMQGVNVSFIYYSSDGKEILHFTRSQNACCAPSEP